MTLLNIIPGTLKVTPTHIYFYEHEKDETHHKLSHNNLVWKIKDIREIHLRRYNLRYSAIEFFLTDQTNHFINLRFVEYATYQFKIILGFSNVKFFTLASIPVHYSLRTANREIKGLERGIKWLLIVYNL